MQNEELLFNFLNGLSYELRKLSQVEYYHYHRDLIKNHENPLLKYSTRAFSQHHEDGITLEIIKRLGIKNGTYAEFGVGNGIENNTLVLASLGWKGFWVGGENLAWNPTPTPLWRYYQEWITRNNIINFIQRAANDLSLPSIDLISIDLDGIDIYLAETILSHNIRPRVWIVEYNSHFPPPIPFRVTYDDNHQWRGDTYYGASLQSYVDVMSEHGYELICCEESGANAWFVLKEELYLFPEVPRDINKIYMPPRFTMFDPIGHSRSLRAVTEILKQS
jgi:hypothetical protein